MFDLSRRTDVTGVFLAFLLLLAGAVHLFTAPLLEPKQRQDQALEEYRSSASRALQNFESEFGIKLTDSKLSELDRELPPDDVHQVELAKLKSAKEAEKTQRDRELYEVWMRMAGKQPAPLETDLPPAGVDPLEHYIRKAQEEARKKTK